VPFNLPLVDACASLMQGLTAHYLTHSTFPIQKGDTVLVHAAAGGTGGLVVEMAKLRGATVFATVSSDDKAALAKKLGADHVINYTQTNFQKEVMKLTNGKGVKCVYDGVGKATWENSMLSLAPLGMLVLFGNASGKVPDIDPLLLSKNGSLFLTRPTLKDYTASREVLLSRARELFAWMTENKVHIRIAHKLPLKDAAEGHKLITGRDTAGKIVLIVDSDLK